MRPHRLRMTAFGPFAGAVEVDLDRLASGGLFLLHGETGAGKTTLLDGLGFALYGSVPGARQKGGRLRSDHACPGVRTEVQLEVTLGGRRWRITRSPAQERPKSRGTGSTTEQASVLLEEQRAGGWRTVSTRIDEAAAELDPLLGMSADQFFQVVLLPQGEFARFLRADSKDRGLLLQRLFGTERFRAVEDWLAARRVATAATVTAARQGLEVLVARLAQAAAVQVPAGVVPDRLAEVVPGWSGEVVATTSRRAADATVEAAGATAIRDVARVVAAAEGRLADRQERLRAALAARDLLAAQRLAHQLLGAELAAADRAAEIAPVLTEAARREAARVALVEAERQARAALPGVGRPVGAPPAALRTATDAARARSGRLDGFRAVADDLATERAAAAAAAREVTTCTREIDRLAALLAGLPTRLAQAQAQVTAARSATAELPGRVAELLALTSHIAEARGLTAVLAQLRQLRDEHLLARETAVSLREKESELRESRVSSMIAELAFTLEPGSPCAVCGSLAHPDPYDGAGDTVSREDEERARLAAEQAARQVAEVDARIAAATATADGHRARLLPAAAAPAGADHHERALDVRALEAQCHTVSAVVDRLRAAAGRLEPALAAVELIEQEQVRGDADLARAAAAGDGAGRRGDEALARAERLAARLVAELDGAPDLAAALAVVSRICQACDAVLTAADQARRAADEAADATRAAAVAAVEAGFEGPGQAAAAVRTPAWRDQARRRRREHDDRAAAVAAALGDPELAVPLDPGADVEGAAAALRAADVALTEAVGILAEAQNRVTQVASLAPRLADAAAALRPLEQQAALVKRLADLCAGGGSNALRMSLSSFVLAARLEEVAAAASGRLLRMTQGRYSLLHTDGAAKGGARSGLGLLVRDSWTGRDRETGTLSGGETFQASLALALGLADVVQAEAGGTRIEALFVDEGFGTLDEQTLDEVMDVLDGLREGGRVVGLVSHVAELKARIPARVHVHKDRDGSTLTLEGC